MIKENEISSIKKEIESTKESLVKCMETLTNLSNKLMEGFPNPEFVKIILPDDVIEYDSPDFVLRGNSVDGKCEILIEISTGKIINWKGNNPSALFCKACDEGVYILYNENMIEITRVEGYVPNKLIPEHDGYGDYIDININSKGYIKNWYNNPSLEEFKL